jgi:hypothetical protein
MVFQIPVRTNRVLAEMKSVGRFACQAGEVSVFTRKHDF